MTRFSLSCFKMVELHFIFLVLLLFLPWREVSADRKVRHPGPYFFSRLGVQASLLLCRSSSSSVLRGKKKKLQRAARSLSCLEPCIGANPYAVPQWNIGYVWCILIVPYSILHVSTSIIIHLKFIAYNIMLKLCWPFHSQLWSISNYPCWLTRNLITSHSTKNLAFYS